jgi:hypothetical protein
VQVEQLFGMISRPEICYPRVPYVGFMLSISQSAPRHFLHNLVNYLVPELQRRGRYRTSYEGKTLRENMLA